MDGGRRSGKWMRKRSSSKLFRRGIDRKRAGRRGSMGFACLGSKQEVGSGQSLSLKKTGYPGDRPGQQITTFLSFSIIKS